MKQLPVQEQTSPKTENKSFPEVKVFVGMTASEYKTFIILLKQVRENILLFLTEESVLQGKELFERRIAELEAVKKLDTSIKILKGEPRSSR